MNDWKIPTALSLFIISGIELLTIRDNYRVATNVFVMGMEVLFGVTVIVAAYLFIKGLLAKKFNQ